ncbi:MAG: hypothetical protein HY898_10575 [Deltaproteobacteria bacterium]|nr:hypothetical protein [Deltaproteobacteria bacterium]
MRGKVLLLVSALASSCGAQKDMSERVSDPTGLEREALALPAWAEAPADSSGPASHGLSKPPRSFETRAIAPAPEGDPLARVMQGRGSRRVKNMSFHQAPVAEILRMLASTGGFNLVIADGVPDKRLTIDLRNVTLQHAFEAVLASAQLQAEPIGSEIVLVKVATAGR